MRWVVDPTPRHGPSFRHRGSTLQAELVLKGAIIGFSIAAPVGPIGLLCIRRTLAEGRLAGLVSGMGAATADGLYGAIAGFGLSFLSEALLRSQTWLRILGGLYLCYLGTRIFLSRVAERPVDHNRKGMIGAYASTFFLTITNPVTIIAFLAVFAGLGVTKGGDPGEAGALVAGVFLGSAAWWLTLALGVGFLRARFTPMMLMWVNRLAGALIAGFGVFAIYTL
jgi:threonine/homoserine/homoserine lactone efflux protein